MKEKSNSLSACQRITALVRGGEDEIHECHGFDRYLLKIHWVEAVYRYWGKRSAFRNRMGESFSSLFR